VSNTAGITAGDYMINILGTSPTVSDQNIMLSLNVEDAAPASTSLLAPANGSVGADNPPSLSWTDTGAVDYLVEIATDSGFTNVIFSDTTAGTTLVPAVSLNSSSTYFWRVSSNNSCGTSAPSTAFSFTTSTLICFSVNEAIPDNTPAGLDSVFTIPDTGTLSNIDVAVEATHTWIGDVSFTLSKDGTDVVVMDRPGVPASTFGCSGDNVSATFTDSSAIPVESECGTNPAITGDLQPQEPLSSFNGIEFSGNWTFNANDSAAGDTGTLVEVCFVPSFATPTCDPAPPTGDPDIIWFNGFQCVQEP
jgi:subtilisin-like proprotein convertase family protein